MANFLPGQEPEKVQKRLQRLFEKLDQAYPDKCVVGLYSDHKHWGETVTELYKMLGYTEGKAFLEAYGYTYERKETTVGRPREIDPEAIIDALKKRYPNGSPYKKIDELFEENPEYLPKLKTLKNNSESFFGMPLGKYLKSIGLLQSSSVSKPKKEYYLCKVSIPGIDAQFSYLLHSKTIQTGDFVAVPFGKLKSEVFGKVEDIIICTEDTAPCDLEALEKTIQKIGVRQYWNEILRNVLNANAAVETDMIFNGSSRTNFEPAQSTGEDAEYTITWAIGRGLSTEIIKVMDHLREKDDQIYDYTDIILVGNGIAELFLYTSDVRDVMERFPDVKIVMFGEKESNGTVDLLYSGSGYPGVTKGYEVGPCNLKNKNRWTLKHSPVEDFAEGKIDYKFRFIDDWNEVNYVFTDSNGVRKQLGEAR